VVFRIGILAVGVGALKHCCRLQIKPVIQQSYQDILDVYGPAVFTGKNLTGGYLKVKERLYGR
jgi:hypothetical protein